MRKFWGAMALLTGLAGADTPPPKPESLSVPVAIRAELVQLGDDAIRQLAGRTRLDEGYFSNHGRVLQTQELLSVSGEDALIFVGHKSPVVYYDARASQFQIQYVDTGVKLDIKVEAEGPDRFRVESRPEYSKTESNKTAGVSVYPQTVVVISNTSLSHVKFGESFIVGRMEGTAARQYLEGMNSPNPTQGDHLFTVITLVKP